MKQPRTAATRDPDSGQAFVARARDAFDAACGHVDHSHAAGLARARWNALRAGPQPRVRPGWAIATGAIAAGVLVAAILVGRPWSAHAPDAPGDAAPITAGGPAGDDELATAIASGQVEVAEHLEFYQWLAAQSRAGKRTSRRGGD